MTAQPKQLPQFPVTFPPVGAGKKKIRTMQNKFTDPTAMQPHVPVIDRMAQARKRFGQA